jgi:hypothetical protein
MNYFIIYAGQPTSDIQAALTACATGGGVVFVVNGTFSVTSPLVIGSNTHLQLGPGVLLVRTFAGLPTIYNAGYASSGDVNIRVSGGRLTTNASQLWPGKHLNFGKVTGLSVIGTRFEDVHNDWNTAFTDCSDVVVSQIVMRSGTSSFEDGLHFAGCRRVTVSDSLIECGDDALSLTNESAVGNVNPLEDFVATNLYLYSHRANPVRISVIKEPESSWTPMPIRRVRLSNIVAKAGDATGNGGCLLIRGLLPPESQDLITDIEIDGFTFDASQTGVPLNFDNAKRIRVSRFVALQPGARAEIDACTDVELNDCVIDAPRTSAAQCLLVAASPMPSQSAACANIRVVGGQYRHATQNAIALGNVHPVTGFEISGTLIQGQTDPMDPTRNTLNGVLLGNATEGIVQGNNILGCNFKGIAEASTSTNNLFIANRVKGNTLGGLAVVGQTSDAARNFPTPGTEADDTGGFRQTIDGWKFANLNVTTPLTEMTRVAGRFRAVRKGSVTGIVARTSLATGSLTASVTVRVYKNTGAFGAPGIPTGLFTTITQPDNGRKAATQNQDANVNSIFDPGDEIYITVESSQWSPALTDVWAALEIED